MIVSIEQLHLSPLRRNRRIPKPSVSTIERIRRFGQVDPVIVRRAPGGGYEILANLKTWLAVQRAGHHDVLITLKQDLSDAEALAMINNDAHRDPIDEAQWFLSLLEAGEEGARSGAELARSLGVNRAYVSHALRLLSLPEPIQQALRDGRLKAGQARALVGVPDTRRQASLAARAVRDQWSVRRTERECRQSRQGTAASAERVGKSPETRALERELTAQIGSQVTIDEEQGHLLIDYQRDLDVLDGILERLGYSPA